MRISVQPRVCLCLSLLSVETRTIFAPVARDNVSSASLKVNTARFAHSTKPDGAATEKPVTVRRWKIAFRYHYLLPYCFVLQTGLTCAFPGPGIVPPSQVLPRDWPKAWYECLIPRPSQAPGRRSPQVTKVVGGCEYSVRYLTYRGTF